VDEGINWTLEDGFKSVSIPGDMETGVAETDEVPERGSSNYEEPRATEYNNSNRHNALYDVLKGGEGRLVLHPSCRGNRR